MTTKNGVKSVQKLFFLLEEMAKNKEMKLKDLSEISGLPKSTVHRLLSSLREIGYVNQNNRTGEYSLGLKILKLTHGTLNNLNLRDVAYPYLKMMKDRTKETANLVVLAQNEALYIEKVPSESPIRFFSLIGKKAPLHATGVGKALLADMAWPDIMTIIKSEGLVKLTPNTITDVDSLMEELFKVRTQGYSIDNEECEVGAYCIAAPIRNYSGKAIASVSISAPIGRLNENKKTLILKTVLKYSSAISKEMGYFPDDHSLEVLSDQTSE